MKTVMDPEENQAKIMHDLAGDLHTIDTLFTVLLEQPAAVSERILKQVHKKLRRSIEAFRTLQYQLQKATNELLHGQPFPTFIEQSDPVELLEELLKDSVDINVDFINRLKPGVEVCVHPGEFKLLLTSLLDNARDAQREKPDKKIEVSLSEHEGMVNVRVRDYGEGISKFRFKKIFEQGFTTKPEGSGYGLYYVRRLVQRLGGRIQVQSREQKGSVFTLSLPSKTEMLNQFKPLRI